MSTHNIGFYEDLIKIIFDLSSNTHLISSAEKAIALSIISKRCRQNFIKYRLQLGSSFGTILLPDSIFSLRFSFTGCVQNLTVNNQQMDLQSHTHSVFGNDPPEPAPGCPREEMCTTEPCENEGQCQGGWQGFTCACTDSFTDKTCSSGIVTMLLPNWVPN